MKGYRLQDTGSGPPSVVLCFQGGASLSAFTAGAAAQIISQTKLEGATGTSSGGMNALKLVWAYIAGLRAGGIKEAQKRSVAALALVWEKAIDYQGWIQVGCKMAEAIPGMRAYFRAASKIYLQHAAPLEMPLLKFLESTIDENTGANAQAEDGDPFLHVNATRYRGNVWEADPQDEVVLSLNGRTVAQQHRAVTASGDLEEFAPIEIDGDLLCDGAYSSPIPDWKKTAEFCDKNGHHMFILRTRPGHAYPDPELIKDPEERKHAILNKKMDDVIVEIRKLFPHLKLHIVEPDRLEKRLDQILTNEMSFDRPRIEALFAAGQKAARLVMEKELGLAPLAAADPAKQKSKAIGLMDVWAASMAFACTPFVILTGVMRNSLPKPSPVGHGFAD